MSVATGGSWSAVNKQKNVDAFYGTFDRYSADYVLEDPSSSIGITKIENILNQSLIEQQLYDFKIGLTSFDDKAYQEKTVAKCVETLLAMANTGKNKRCYVLIGVADNEDAAKKLEEVHGVKAIEAFEHYVTGVGHDCSALGVSEDAYFAKLCSGVASQPIDPSTAKDILAEAKMVSYYDRSIIVLQLDSGTEPRMFDDKYKIRQGTSNHAVPMNEVAWLFKRFEK